MEKPKYTYTKREEDFCQAYILTGVQIEAYAEAFSASRMKPMTIASNASKLFNSPKIQARIQALRDEVKERNLVTLDEIVDELANMIRFDPAEMYDELGDLKSIHEMPKPVRQMIAGLDIQTLMTGQGEDKKHTGYLKRVKLIDKLGAIDKLMKYLGGYEKHNNQKPQQNVVVFELPNNKRDKK